MKLTKLLPGLILLFSSSLFAATGKPNILVIWGDDIGQSNISAYTMGLMGYRTPNIDRIAAEGVLFEDATAVIGKTGPSVATAFSSLDPPTPGARRNCVRMRQDVPVLAEILRAGRYEVVEWIVGQGEPPTPAARQPVVWVVVPPPIIEKRSLAPTEAELALIDAAAELVARGEPVLLSFCPSPFVRPGQPDPEPISSNCVSGSSCSDSTMTSTCCRVVQLVPP